MLLSREISIRQRQAVKEHSCMPLFSLLCVTSGFSHRAQQDEGSQPKYDLYHGDQNQGCSAMTKAAQYGIREPAIDCMCKGA